MEQECSGVGPGSATMLVAMRSAGTVLRYEPEESITLKQTVCKTGYYKIQVQNNQAKYHLKSKRGVSLAYKRSLTSTNVKKSFERTILLLDDLKSKIKITFN